MYALHYAHRESEDHMTSPVTVVSFGAEYKKRKFDGLFTEAMSLTESMATYLDGQGRRECKKLSRALQGAYVGASMQMTSRMLMLASWALVQRSQLEGEEVDGWGTARAKRAIADLYSDQWSTEHPQLRALPETFQAFYDNVVSLHHRMVAIDSGSRVRGV